LSFSVALASVNRSGPDLKALEDRWPLMPIAGSPESHPSDPRPSRWPTAGWNLRLFVQHNSIDAGRA